MSFQSRFLSVLFAEFCSTKQLCLKLISNKPAVCFLLPDLSRCQQTFATSLEKFRFSYIGGAQTDDEVVISGSLKEFGRLIHQVEEERQRVVSVVTCLPVYDDGPPIPTTALAKRKWPTFALRFCTEIAVLDICR